MFDVLTLLNQNLELCPNLDFVDSLTLKLRTKFFVGNFGHHVTNQSLISTELIAVAAKFSELKYFLKAATDEVSGKVPGEKQMTLPPRTKPNKSNTNLRSKFHFALVSAYKSFDRKLIDLILDYPSQLGHNTFFNAIENCPGTLRTQVAECIVELVETSDALTEVTNTLASVFSSDINVFGVLKAAQKEGEKVTG